MSVILTQKYAHIIEKRGFKRIFYLTLCFFPLLRDILKSGKHRELFSFAVWEFLYAFKFYSKKETLKFDDATPLVIKENMDIKKLKFKSSQELFEIRKSPFDWKVLFIETKGDIYGTLADNDKIFYKKAKDLNEIEKLYTFEDSINSLFISKAGVILLCSCGNLYRSEDKGKSFEKVLSLTNPKNPQSYIFHSNGFTQCDDGSIFIGEYGNVAKDGKWMNVANIFKSCDDGKSWNKSDFLKQNGVNKHVHMVKYSKNLKRVFLSDGDNLKKLWISTKDGDFDIKKDWKLINRFHIQMGGYTSMCEVGNSLYFGTDYLGGTNFLVTTVDGKKYTKKVIPDPYRRSPVMNLKKLSLSKSEMIWAILHNPISSETKCLLMCSNDGGDHWKKVVEYDGTRFEIELNSDTNETAETLFFTLTDQKNNLGVCYEIHKKGSE